MGRKMKDIVVERLEKIYNALNGKFINSFEIQKKDNPFARATQEAYLKKLT